MKTLIVYYSWSGKTELVALELAKALKADVRRIEDVHRPGTFSAFVFGGVRAMIGLAGRIKPMETGLASYDRVFVGTPVWAWRQAPAVNACLDRTDFSGKQVVLFATMDGAKAGGTITGMMSRVKRRGGSVIDSFSVSTGGLDDDAIIAETRRRIRRFIGG